MKGGLSCDRLYINATADADPGNPCEGNLRKLMDLLLGEAD